MGSGRNPATISLGLAGLLALSLVGYDLVRAYWLPIELKHAMGGHYVMPAVSSSHEMRTGLRTKKRDWRKRDIQFTYYLRRGGRGTRLRGEATVETRFLKYAGLPTITVSMDRDVFVTHSAEIQEFQSDMFDIFNKVR